MLHTTEETLKDGTSGVEEEKRAEVRKRKKGIGKEHLVFMG